ncbi:hypothetical protein LTR53_004411 [Teratosphaeriaceae sp. CCFEE 6253]|nr:hypothetical protein LTR53_004411 [Teratosphaeriaceae sp. CCFEE 6253]
MPARTIYYVYNIDRPMSRHEERVIAMGYKYVSTTYLLPGDRLEVHSHQSPNTHLVISGFIELVRPDDNLGLRARTGPNSEIAIPSGMEYKGEAGDTGCTFVEGHTLLSPTTANRFESRGTIKRARRGDEGAFTTVGH